MKRCLSRLLIGLFATTVLAEGGFAQTTLTSQEVRDKFEFSNPSLRAGQIGIEETRAQEITSHLRRAQLDIDRNQKLVEATRARMFSDVDSAYAAVASTVILLQPYKDRYLQQASRIRDTISFSYEHDAASLRDFLNAQADYRRVQLNYLSLVASYWGAASQLNLAVGREVIQ